MRRFRVHSNRWIPLLLTVVYAIFGGVSFQFFHELMQESVAGLPQGKAWLYGADATYILLTVLLIFLLISRLVKMLNEYESAIESSEERFRSVVEMTRDWVWEIDENCQYTFAGPTMETMLGLA